MAIVTLNFGLRVNISCQVGDTAYWVPTGPSGGFDINTSPINLIGTVTVVKNKFIKCFTTAPAPPLNAFILFTKDNKANMSSLLGYFMELDIRNNSIGESEMFQITADYNESSK